jgi:cytochrome P450
MKLKNEFNSLVDLRHYFKSLRAHGDIYPINTSTFLVTDYDLMRMIFRQPDNFRTFDFGDRIKKLSEIDPEKYDFQDIQSSMSDWLLFMDGPDHLAWKKRLMQRLYGLQLETIIEDEWEIVSSSLEDLETFDLMSDLCEPLICRILCSIIGFNRDDFNAIRLVEKSFMKAFVPSMSVPVLQEIKKAHQEFHDLQKNWWLQGTISQARLLETLIKDLDLSEQKRIFSQMEFLLTAGIETSILLLTETMFRLLSDLRDYQTPLMNKDSARWIIEELIRHSSSVSMVSRKVMNDVTLNDFQIKKGQILLLFIASANRDGKYFPYPDEIHQDNLQLPNLSFGLGRHHCMGSELSKLEMHTILPLFIKKFGKFKISKQEKIKTSFYTPGIGSATVTM